MTLFCAEKSLWFVGKITIFVTPKNEQNQNDMAENKKIKTALVSVYHKDGLDEIINKLHADGVEFISTGGTQSFIESLGIPCRSVESLTGYPSILGGRVKTLGRRGRPSTDRRIRYSRDRSCHCRSLSV